MQCEDWETGEMVTIQLDRSKPPSETAEGLYKAARKQDRTGDAIAPIIEVKLSGQDRTVEASLHPI